MAEYAISFDGVNDHLSFPEIATTSSSGSEDWEFEFKWTMQDTGWQRAFARLISGGDDRALFNATEFRWYRGASAVIWAGLSLSVSVDYVFKIVASQSSGVYELFVDGVSRGTKTASIGLPFPLFAYSGVNYDTYSTGHLHYFKFTDNADPTNSRHYALNEGSGLLALDNLEPDAKKGSLVNAPVWLDMGGGAWAVDFDYASQQYGKTNYAPPDSDFEIEIDVTFGSVSTSENHKTLFSYDDDGSSNAILTLYHHKWDGVKAQISTGGLGQIVTVTGPKYAAGARKKFKVVYQKLSQIELWIDDVLHASMPITYDYGAFKSLRLAHKSTSGDYFDGLIHSFKCTDLAGPRDRLFAMNEGAGAEINDSLFPLNAERSVSLVNFPGDDSQWILVSGGGGTTYEVSANYSQTFGMTTAKSAVISASAAFSQSFSMSQGANGTLNTSADFAQIMQAVAQSVAAMGAQISAGITSDTTAANNAAMNASVAFNTTQSTIAASTATLNAEATFNTQHGVSSAGGLSLQVAAAFAVQHAMQSSADISIEAIADFSMSVGMLCAAVAEANAQIDINVIHSAVAETLAILNAQASYGITSGLSVTRGIDVEAGITCSITSSFTATGTIVTAGSITTPDSRTLKILAENRTLTISFENRTLKIEV